MAAAKLDRGLGSLAAATLTLDTELLTLEANTAAEDLSRLIDLLPPLPPPQALNSDSRINARNIRTAEQDCTIKGVSL